MRISDWSSDVCSSDLFAFDSYRRFIAMYAEIVLGLDGEAFDRLLETAREWDGVELDRDISADTLRHLCGRYQQIVAEQSGAPFPQDPEVQPRPAIEAVFRSWGGDRAVAYRVRAQIQPDLGTAVNGPHRMMSRNTAGQGKSS